jgi:type I restriction enzyme, S subunit
MNRLRVRMNKKNDRCNLPSSWELVRLGDFVNSEKGKKPKRENRVKTSTHYLPYIDIEAFESGVLKSWTDGENCKICNENDFLMVWDGSRSGLVGKGLQGALGSTLVKISFPQIYNNYAYYFLKSKFLEINTRAKGSGTPHVDPDLLWNYDFPVPPFAEQKRIVAKIEELFSEIDKSIENLLKTQELLKAYRQSLLKNAFEGKLTAEWRDANNIEATDSKIYLQFILEECQTKNHLKEVKNVSTNLNAIPKLPSGWIWTNLDSLIYISQNGLSKRQGLNGIQTDVLRLADIKNKCIKTNNLRQIVCSESEIKKYQLFTSDILCIRVNGSTELVGQLISYQEKKKTQLFCDHFIRLRPLNSEISTYLCMYGLTDFARRFMEKHMVSTAGQNTISQFSLLQMPIPFPGKSEQKQIISILQTNLSIVDKLEENLFACTDQMKALRQSVLKKAFSGELVPQDANDEPANVLLERIQAEKEIPRPQKKKSKQLQKAAI